MPQKEKIISYLLEHETINREQAMNELYIYNLPARVSELRHKKGFSIPCVIPQGQRHGYYTLSSTDLERLTG